MRLSESSFREVYGYEWFVRHARRVLHERASAGKLSDASARNALRRMLHAEEELPRKLRALWALYCVGGIDEPLLASLLRSP